MRFFVPRWQRWPLEGCPPRIHRRERSLCEPSCRQTLRVQHHSNGHVHVFSGEVCRLVFASLMQTILTVIPETFGQGTPPKDIPLALWLSPGAKHSE